MPYWPVSSVYHVVLVNGPNSVLGIVTGKKLVPSCLAKNISKAAEGGFVFFLSLALWNLCKYISYSVNNNLQFKTIRVGLTIASMVCFQLEVAKVAL